MKMHTDHMDVTWVSCACNFEVRPLLSVASTYVHVCWDVREALSTNKMWMCDLHWPKVRTPKVDGGPPPDFSESLKSGLHQGRESECEKQNNGVF